MFYAHYNFIFYFSQFSPNGEVEPTAKEVLSNQLDQQQSRIPKLPQLLPEYKHQRKVLFAIGRVKNVLLFILTVFIIHFHLLTLSSRCLSHTLENHSENFTLSGRLSCVCSSIASVSHLNIKIFNAWDI